MPLSRRCALFLVTLVFPRATPFHYGYSSPPLSSNSGMDIVRAACGLRIPFTGGPPTAGSDIQCAALFKVLRRLKISNLGFRKLNFYS